jgi:hypothetical protein
VVLTLAETTTVMVYIPRTLGQLSLLWRLRLPHYLVSGARQHFALELRLRHRRRNSLRVDGDSRAQPAQQQHLPLTSPSEL